MLSIMEGFKIPPQGSGKEKMQKPSGKFFQEIFRKGFQNKKPAKSLCMKGKTAAIFGNDSRESFPNSSEEEKMVNYERMMSK